MTFRTLAALTVLTVTAGTALVAAPAFAQTATTPTTLYVSGSPGCTDSPTRTAGQAYCTVQAAADAAQPGQTVLLAPGTHVGAVTLTHSGQPDAPITISGANPNYPYNGGGVSGSAQPAFTLNDVHDIVLTSMDLISTGNAVAVDGGSDISLTSDNITGGTTSTAAGTSAISVTGATGGLTVSRSTVRSIYGSGVTIGQGASKVVVTSDIVVTGGANGISATDAPGTEVVGDTLSGRCADQLQLAGSSANSVIENDIVDEPVAAPGCPTGDGAGISVSGASTSGTTVDYNIVDPQPLTVPYSWGGTPYSSPGAFTTATGQGGHDIQADPKTGDNYRPLEGSPAVDSADGSAPGETTVDYYGHARADDPVTPNTGSSQGFYDRGAVEMQDPYAFTGVTVDHTTGTFPLAVTATAAVTNPWDDPISSYTWNFGDGTPTVTTTTPTYTHTYDTAPPTGQNYTITVTVTSNGTTKTQSLSGITPTDPGPLVPRIRTAAVGDAFSLTVQADSTASTDPLPITSRTISFGDHTPAVDATATGTVDHTYAAAGFYSVVVTETDSAGRTSNTGTTVIVGQPPAFWRNDLMARDTTGRLWQYQGTGRATAPYAARTLVGSGWNAYNLMVSPEGHTAAGSGDLVARDTSGVLWYYQGTGNPTTPYKSRLRVGGGWNAYNMIVAASPLNGGGGGDLVARDTSGVLWYYQGTGNPTMPYKSRLRVGGGWNAYNTMTDIGTIGSDAAAALVARDANGVLWLYQGTGNPNDPFTARVRVGGGWNTYNTLMGAGLLNGDLKNDLIARDANGNLWLYPGTGDASAPFGTPTRIGGGWNTYNAFA